MMVHIFEKGTKQQTLLLLHGTGGDEYDLLPIGRYIDSHANILSIRGHVVENGANRFFKRYAIGQYDLVSLETETNRLYHFIDEASQKYQFDRRKMIAVGFSNGANIAESLIQVFGKSLDGAILFNPVYIQPNLKFKDLNGIKIFIAASRVNDPFASFEDIKRLETDLKLAGAIVEVYWHNEGHRLIQSALVAAKTWYDRI